MQASVIHRDDSPVFYYGFLSSRISGVLSEYLRTHQIPESAKSTLEDARKLVSDVITAQKLFGKAKDAAVPSDRELDAFGCALEVIIANSAVFGVKDIRQLADLFQTINKTLEQILKDARPSSDKITQTRMFFKHLAERMLARLSAFEEAELTVA